MNEQSVRPALIYVRVSDKSQKLDGSGQESQETVCRELARSQGYVVERVFKDDMTGQKSDRPGIKELIAYLRKNKKKRYVVLLDDQSRLARSSKAFWTLRDDLDLIEAQLEGPQGIYKNDADSRYNQNMVAAANQRDVEKNQERVISRMSARVIGGYYPFTCPRGYLYKKVRGRGKMLFHNEPETSIIKEALEGYACGRFTTQEEVRRFLEAHPLFLKGKNATLSKNAVPAILKNAIYAGYVEAPCWNISRRKGLHEPIIDYATFLKIQDRLAGKAYMPARKDINEDFPLRGFVVCECEQPYRAGWSKGRHARYAYYTCQNRACLSYGKSIKREMIEGELEAMLQSVKPMPGVFTAFREMLCEMYEVRTRQVRDGLSTLKDDLKRLERQAEKLIDLSLEAESRAIVARYEKRQQEIELERLQIVEKINASRKPFVSFDQAYRTALQFLENPLKVWSSGRIDDKRTCLKLIFGDRLQFIRNEGYRTADYSMPIRVLRDLCVPKGQVVDAAGIEPATLRV